MITNTMKSLFVVGLVFLLGQDGKAAEQNVGSSKKTAVVCEARYWMNDKFYDAEIKETEIENSYKFVSRYHLLGGRYRVAVDATTVRIGSVQIKDMHTGNSALIVGDLVGESTLFLDNDGEYNARARVKCRLE